MKVYIRNRENGKQYRATITKMREKDFDKIKSSNQFDKFEWSGLITNRGEVFKLVKSGAILGLMQFARYDIWTEEVFELTKLELSKENRRTSKKYENIAGCLIAYACLKSIKTFTGEIAIYYSKETKAHYIARYGMTAHDEYYVKSDKINSMRLIKEYLDIDC